TSRGDRPPISSGGSSSISARIVTTAPATLRGRRGGGRGGDRAASVVASLVDRPSVVVGPGSVHPGGMGRPGVGGCRLCFMGPSVGSLCVAAATPRGATTDFLERRRPVAVVGSCGC